MTTDDRESPEKLPAYLIRDQIFLVDAFPEAVKKNRAKYLCEVPLWGAIQEAYNDRPMAPYWSVYEFKELIADLISAEITKAQNLWDALSVFGVPINRKNQILKETADEDMISAYEAVLTKINQVTYVPIQRAAPTLIAIHQYLTKEKFDFTSLDIDKQIQHVPRLDRH